MNVFENFSFDENTLDHQLALDKSAIKMQLFTSYHSNTPQNYYNTKTQHKHGDGCVASLHCGSQQSPLRPLQLPHGNVRMCTQVDVCANVWVCVC